MKKSRLQELAGIKKPLNEGYAWERDENGALPTLASSTARHAANENVTDSEEDKLDQISKELNKASKMHKGQSKKIANLVKEAVMSTVEAENMAVEILNQFMDNGIVEQGFDEELATELIVLTLTGGPGEI